MEASFYLPPKINTQLIFFFEIDIWEEPREEPETQNKIPTDKKKRKNLFFFSSSSSFPVPSSWPFRLWRMIWQLTARINKLGVCVCVCVQEKTIPTHTRVKRVSLSASPTCKLPQISVKKSGSDDRRKNQVYRERKRMMSSPEDLSPLAEVESPPIAPSSFKIFQPNEKPCRLFDGGRRRRTHTATAAVLSLPPPRIDYVNPCLKAGPVTTQRVEMGVAQLCQNLKEKSQDKKRKKQLKRYYIITPLLL